jgi:hypothetical protein
MSDSLADLLKRQQQSNPAKSPTSPAEASPDEAAEMAKIAKQQAAKAAAVAGRVLGKATKLGIQHSVRASQHAQQKLSEVTPEQWIKVKQTARQIAFAILVLAGFVVIIWGGIAGWKALAGHLDANAVPKQTATSATKPTPANSATVTPAKPLVAVSPVTAFATAGEPSTMAPQGEAVGSPTATQPIRAAVEPTPAVPNQTPAAQPRRKSPRPRQQGVNSKYRATAPQFDEQSQKNIQALNDWFQKLNQQKEKPATSAAQGNTNGSQPAHQ